MADNALVADLLVGIAMLKARYPGYDKAHAFYEGEAGEVFASPKVRRALAKSGLNEMDSFNFAKIPVDTVVNRLKVTGVRALKPDGEPDQDAQAELDQIWAANKLDLELHRVLQDASKLADGYLFVWPAFAQAEEGEDPVEVGVDVLVNDARTVIVVCDDEHPMEPVYAVKYWCYGGPKGKEVYRANLYYPDVIYKYESQPGTKADKPQQWKLIGEVENPYGMLPVFALSIERPEHYWAYGPQTLINKLIVSHAASIDFQSFPIRYGLQDPKLDDTSGGADFDEDYPEDTGADPEDPDNQSRLRADPNDFWHLIGYKGVGEFRPADPSVFLTPFDRYVRAMAQLTDTPFHYFDPTGEAPSGESLRTADAPLTSKTDNRKTVYQPSISDALEFALVIRGFEDVTVVVDWGASTAIVENEKTTELDHAAKVVAMLKDLGDAVTSGLIDQEAANTLLSRLLDMALPAEG